MVKVESAERHHAMVNFGAPRFLVCWEPYSGCGPAGRPAAAMVMIAVVTSLAMRLPNPRMVAIDFIYGTLAALPLGALYFR